jgi:hypothetical protein
MPCVLFAVRPRAGFVVRRTQALTAKILPGTPAEHEEAQVLAMWPFVVRVHTAL